MGVMDLALDFPVWAALPLAVLVMAAVHYNKVYGKFRKLGIYNPLPLPFLGNALFNLRHGFFDGSLLSYKLYKDKKVFGSYEGNSAVLTITDLDMIHDVTIKKFNDFTDRKTYAAMNQKGIDSILFNITGAYWKEQRTLIKPSLSPARLKAISGNVEALTQRMLDVMKEKASKDGNVEITELIGSLCMDIIAGLAYDVKCDSLRNPNNEFLTNSRNILDVFASRLFNFEFFAPPYLKEILDFLGIMILPKKEVNYFRDYTKRILKTRRAMTGDTKPDDLLQYMLNRSGEKSAEVKRPFTEEEIYATFITYILAGYDTSAKGFHFSMYHLAMNPHCFKKAQKEVDEVLQGQFPTKENVENLPYLTACIKEANRMFPLGFIIERKCVQDTTVRGQFIPRGMIVRIPVIGIHRDPEIYPNPNFFDPERFQPEVAAKRHPMAFLPFGAGPRSCFGQPLAMMIMRIGMAALIQAFDMEPCEKSEYPIRIGLHTDMIVDHGLWLKVTPRK